MAIDPALNVARAAQLYDQAQQSGVTPSTIPVQDTQPQTPGTFSALVSGYLTQAQQVGQVAEQTSIAGIMGQADLATVATSVTEAELTLQTVVAIRDKVVEAYREILRMPM